MTPYELHLVLNAHVSPDQPFDGCDAPIYDETMRKLLGMGLFDISSGPYVATAKLHAFCKFLCMMPLPMQNWSIAGSLIFSLPAE